LAERIFEPFFTTKSDGQGTGLGLSYAKDVINDHGGSLTVTTSQCGGAAFIVTVPSANLDQVAPGA
jgi:signal transduction histidine kinase